MARKAQNPRRQIFRFTDDNANSVLLVGDFTHWQQNAIPMQRGTNGLWSTAIELAPGKHTYRFIVDGEWRDDPECTARVPNPFGSQDMVRQVA